MATDTPRIPEQGVATLPDQAWERVRRRTLQDAGLVTDFAPGQSSGGKGKGRLLESVERISASCGKSVS